MATTLVIRLSSLGDVAIAIPVLYSVAKNYPDDHFLLLTQVAWQSLFVDKPSNLTVFPVYTKGKHKGIVGIIRLLRELSPVIRTKELKVADLHGVLRCSIFGNKPCLRSDYACLKQITPEMIVEKIKASLHDPIPNRFA